MDSDCVVAAIALRFMKLNINYTDSCMCMQAFNFKLSVANSYTQHLIKTFSLCWTPSERMYMELMLRWIVYLVLTVLLISPVCLISDFMHVLKIYQVLHPL